MQSIQYLIQKVVAFFTSIKVAPIYLQAGAVIFLLFLLIIAMAQFRQHFVKWSFKGGLVGLVFGFILAILLEGFLLLNGQTVVISLLGWKNAPKPIGTALKLGREKLTNILEIPTDSMSASSAGEALTLLQSLNPDEIKKIKAIICTP